MVEFIVVAVGIKSLQAPGINMQETATMCLLHDQDNSQLNGIETAPRCQDAQVQQMTVARK